MKATIVTIGDEILIGQIVDTNSAFIAKGLNKIGITVHQIRSIQDDSQQIIHALDEAREHTDLVLLTGGLGPTNDDITKQTLCAYFDDTLVENKAALAHLKQLFAAIEKPELFSLNRHQALLPKRAKILENTYGTAVGMWFEDKSTVFISMPGVPFEMKHIFQEEVIPRLRDRAGGQKIIHKTILTFGIAESALAKKIETWEAQLPSFIKLAYLPNFGMVRLRLTAKGSDENTLTLALTKEIKELHERVGEFIKGYEDEGSLEVQIANKLVQLQKTFATVESCTGGQIGAIFNKHPGASAYYQGSIVSYASSVKEDLLQIPKAIVDQYSVVSAEVTKRMAVKGQQLLKADYVLATTGNAGPTKGDSKAEIGTVYIALASPTEVKVFSFQMGNNREKVIGKTLHKSLEILHAELF